MRTRLYSSILVLALAGCAVMPVGYQKPEVPNARYFQDTCGGFGAPEVAYYPYHGIFVSVALVEGYFPAVGLHVPLGMTASLDDNSVKVTGRTAQGEFAVVGVLQAVRHWSFGNWAPHFPPFLWQPDPYRSPTDLVSLQGGGTASGGYFWYLFAAFPSSDSTRYLALPPHVSSGEIELPPITVDGRKYPAQRIPFERRTVVRVMPVNC